MKHIGLFEGIGGFSLAARWMNWETVAWVEIDKFCQKVLRKNFKNSIGYGDIKEFNGKEWKGKIDLITGGFPCQPFSTAGKRGGNADDRALWFEMLRIIEEVEPRFIVGENVTGIKNMELSNIISDLEDRNYTVQTFNISALSVGCIHERQRIWIVAHAKSDRTHRGQGKIYKKNGRQECGLFPQFNYAGFPHDKQKLASELCRMDDGFSAGLDKRKRIKSLGNAIVPQVAFEIFKAIQSFDYQNHERLSINCT